MGGAVAALRASLPFEVLFEPAIATPSDGYHVSPVVAGKWAPPSPSCRRILASPSISCRAAALRMPGERFACPAMATALERIARHRRQRVLRGEIAEAMVAHAVAHGAAHRLDDFASHTVDWVEPMGIDYRVARVHEIPPNGQGIAALIALGVLRAVRPRLAARPTPSKASTSRSRR